MLQLIMSMTQTTAEETKAVVTEYFTYHCPACLSMMVTITVNEDDSAEFVCECGQTGDVEGDLIHVSLS